eukprot:Opistho-2@61679
MAASVPQRLRKYVRGASAEQLHIDGGEITRILFSGADAGGRLSLYESILPKGNLAPYHYHEIDVEIFYIIDGQVEFCVDGEVFVAHPGDAVLAGPLVKRRFTAVTDARLIVINSPAGPSEGLMRDIASLAPGQHPPPEMVEKFENVYKIHIVRDE